MQAMFALNSGKLKSGKDENAKKIVALKLCPNKRGNFFWYFAIYAPQLTIKYPVKSDVFSFSNVDHLLYSLNTIFT